MLDTAFLDWLRTVTEARWADPAAWAPSTGDAPSWQPRTRWRGGISDSDLEIVEAMFGVRLPAAYRQFLGTLHTPDPPRTAARVQGFEIVLVEERLFPDWTGATTPLLGALERPLRGLLQAVELGRWHPAWGERPEDVRQREQRVRSLVAAAPRLIPFAGEHYLAAERGATDGPIVSVRGAEVAVVAPGVRAGLLLELGLSDDGVAAGSPDVTATRVPFWSDLKGGIPWVAPWEPART